MLFAARGVQRSGCRRARRCGNQTDGSSKDLLRTRGFAIIVAQTRLLSSSRRYQARRYPANPAAALAFCFSTYVSRAAQLGIARRAGHNRAHNMNRRTRAMGTTADLALGEARPRAGKRCTPSTATCTRPSVPIGVRAGLPSSRCEAKTNLQFTSLYCGQRRVDCQMPRGRRRASSLWRASGGQLPSHLFPTHQP